MIVWILTTYSDLISKIYFKLILTIKSSFLHRCKHKAAFSNLTLKAQSLYAMNKRTRSITLLRKGKFSKNLCKLLDRCDSNKNNIWGEF